MPLYHLTDNAIEIIEATRFDALQIMERAVRQRILKSKVDVIASDCRTE